MSCNNNIKSLVHLSSKTWLKDSNGLFDYESKQTKNVKAFIGESLYITRSGYEINGVKCLPSSQNQETLFSITKSPNSIYQINNFFQTNIEPTKKNISLLNNKIWYIANIDPINNSQENNHFQNTNKDYYITKNDIIKLGRVKYIVNEVNIISEERKDNLNLPENDNNNKENYINKLNANSGSIFNLVYKAKCLDDENIIENNKEEKQLCKICYSEEIDKNNPMVHLCNCKGGLNYAHYECIKQWMKTKLIILENKKKTVKTYYILGFNCEICKTPYPFRFKLNNSEKIYQLIDIEKPINTNYIILESSNQIKENSNIKSIHVISLIDDEDIIIGRGHECDVRIKDISVSRIHSKLKFNPKEKTLLLKDLKSKFGTLILIRSPFEIKETIQIQVGRTYIKASVISFEELKQFQKERQIEREKKVMEEIKSLTKEHLYKNDNLEPIETQYNETENNKKEEGNNNMDIEDN